MNQILEFLITRCLDVFFVIFFVVVSFPVWKKAFRVPDNTPDASELSDLYFRLKWEQTRGAYVLKRDCGLDEEQIGKLRKQMRGE
jgi:hypothetical protein